MILSSSPALADLWYEHYQKGEEALNAQKWNEAVNQLTQAIARRQDPGVGVRTYGMNFINYHPYLKLGIAYFNMGQIDAALKAFDSEESFGAVTKSPGDLKNLQTFRQLAQEASQAGRKTEQQRIAGIVAKGLQDAALLEQQGQIDNAMTALGPGLAVDPNNAELLTPMQRLRDRVAAEARERDLQERVSKALNEGRTLIASGKYEGASSLLSQALSMKPEDAEVKRLLADSQEKLRAEIESRRSEEERRVLVKDGLVTAAQLESGGQILAAMEKLQSVLAVEPQNREARVMLDRLVKAQADAETGKARAEEVARVLDGALALLKDRRYAESVASFNRVIALDPVNPAARTYLGQAYAAMYETIRAGGVPVAVPKLVPVITLTNSTNAEDSDQRPEERVPSPHFVMRGVVTSDQPHVRVTFLAGESVAGEASNLTPKPVGSLYQYLFQQPFALTPGVVTLTVRVSDPRGLTSEELHRVRYVRPLGRSPWLYSGLGLAGVSALAGLQGYRIHRRNRLLKRRFNPYVAGAPVLNDDLFVGREALLSRILQTIHNNSILLYGERRIGKTTLQHHLKRRLLRVKDEDYEFYPVYVDLQGTPQERFFATLAEDIFDTLSHVLDGIRPGRGLADNSPYAYETFVRDIHGVLKLLRQRSPKKVKLVLLIDEVDELNNYDPRINQKLRSLFMKSFAEDLVAVVSGVGIKKHWASEGSPWYNFFEEIEVKPFTRKDAEDLIRRPIQGIFELDRPALDRIIDNTDCKPYLIQKMCIALVNRMHDLKRRRITLADVEAVGRPLEA